MRLLFASTTDLWQVVHDFLCSLLEAVVTVTLEPQGGKTHVTLRHTGAPDDEMGRQHQDGWRDSVIAATARRHALAIATRNVKDYKHAGVDVVNPFD